ncbi:MAG: carboxypeptidase-like regulatory domain-containing protein [Cytophagaceae bacterium]|nr:MAG: carboxypeptidase-like regulatory domain-containing protein [Cytophagaceae bacterium]
MRFSSYSWFVLLLTSLLGPVAARAGVIKGKVSGTNNEGLAFANVAVRGTAASTGSNDQGQYQLRLPAGQYQLVFQYVGYRPRTEAVRVPAGDSTVVLNVALAPESYNLTEVTVRGSDRDPAYAIIQQAQQWRAYHQREVATFQARLYIKSLIRLSETPSKVFGLFKVGPDVKPGILYLSESLSDIRFTQPNTIKERMISSRVSGDSRGISFNRAQGGLNFYDNVLKPSFSARGFVSPVASNSFLFYQYELVGTSQQGGELVHKIKLIPRRRTDPVFSGFIYIVDGSWRIHSVDVRLTKDAQLDYVDDLHIEQLFAPAPGVPHVWALQSQKLSVNFSAFGFKGSGYATAVFSNYNHVVATYPAPPEVKKVPATAAQPTAGQPAALPVVAPVTTKELTRQLKRQKPDLAGLNRQVRRQVKQARRDSVRNDPFAQMKTGEVMLVEKGVNERDSSYWTQIRPVPLTEEEQRDYHKKDSSEVVRKSRPYQDSLDRKRNEFTPGKLLLSGYTHRNTFRKRSLSVQPIFNELQYNTVEGYVLNAQATYTQRTDDKRFVTLTPTLRYGFSNEQLQPSLTLNWQLDPVKTRQVGLVAGRTIENFDRNSQLTPFINSAYSLLANRNYAKLYRRDGAELSYFWEPVNGLTVRSAASYFDRHELENTSSYLWHDVRGRAFTSNQPVAEELPEGTGFGRSQAATLTLSVSYRPGTQYITRPDGKFNLGTKYPTFNAQLRQGVGGVLGANVRYTLLQGRISQTIQLGLLGTSAYEVVLGGFVGHPANLTFVDYRHFSGNRTLLTGNFSDFQLLDYYQYSTRASYFEGHFNHHFNGFIFNKIPLLKALKWQEVFSLNYLQTAQSGPYLELGAGIEHIFKLGRIDFYTALQSREHVGSGIRFGLGF